MRWLMEWTSSTISRWDGALMRVKVVPPHGFSEIAPSKKSMWKWIVRLDDESKCEYPEFLYKRPKKAFYFLSRWSSRCFIGAIVLGVVLIGLQIAFVYFDQKVHEGWSTATLLGVQLALMVGTVMALWQELANYKSTFEGYEKLQMLYQRALFLVNKDAADVRPEMLIDLAQEAMEEHAQWHDSEHQSDLTNR
jgi:hypothetical protein